MIGETQIEAQTFFFISSVGFIVLGIMAGIILFYLIRISRTFSRIIDRAEEDIENIGDTTKEILEEVRESSLFQFFFRFLKKKRKAKK